MFARLLVVDLQKLTPRTRTLVQTCLYGLAAGLAAVAFQLAINWLYRCTLLELSHHSFRTFLIGSFFTVLGTATVAGFLLTSFCSEAAGSGIPQLKLAFWKDFGYVSWRVVWVKFIAGALSIGGGSSLGREGPSVHIAGGLASNLSGALGQPKQLRRLPAAAGAAAGLAAAFNTPLAAITFVLEEVIEDLNSRLLGSVLLASVIGAFVVHGLIGPQPAFKLGGTGSPGWVAYVLIPFVAVLAAIAGATFQSSALALRLRQKQSTTIPPWLRPVIGATIVWILGVEVFYFTGHLGVFSLGYDDLTSGINNQLTWEVAGILLGTKLVATIACYGLGGCGGIFSPTLFFGGMCGVFIGGLAGKLLNLSPSDQTTLAVVGMSGCLGAVVGAPVTGILIVFEMTHEFSLVPALMLGALISRAVGLKLNHHNFYDALLIQDGHKLQHVIPPRDLQGWQQLPVSAIANFHPVILDDLSPGKLRGILAAHPYQRFPVVQDGKLTGMLLRKDAEISLSENRTPKLEPAVTCLPSQSIAELQNRLIESSTLVVVVIDAPEGRPLGLVTLHDMLRAEASIARNGVDA